MLLTGPAEMAASCGRCGGPCARLLTAAAAWPLLPPTPRLPLRGGGSGSGSCGDLALAFCGDAHSEGRAACCFAERNCQTGWLIKPRMAWQSQLVLVFCEFDTLKLFILWSATWNNGEC